MKERDQKNARGEIKKQKTQNGDFVPFKKTFIVHTSVSVIGATIPRRPSSPQRIGK